MLLRRLRNFAQRPAQERRLRIAAWLLLGISRAAVLLIHFRHIAPRLGKRYDSLGFSHLLPQHQQDKARLIGKCIRWASQRSPWDANCFAQAITARILLAAYKVPCTLYFGLSHDSSRKLQAHAWVCAGQEQVTGGNGFAHYSVVGVFLCDSGLLDDKRPAPPPDD